MIFILDYFQEKLMRTFPKNAKKKTIFGPFLGKTELTKYHCTESKEKKLTSGFQATLVSDGPTDWRTDRQACILGPFWLQPGVKQLFIAIHSFCKHQVNLIAQYAQNVEIYLQNMLKVCLCQAIYISICSHNFRIISRHI